MRWLGCCLLFAAAASAQDRFAVDWRKLEPEILAHFTTLLKIDTSNPPGKKTVGPCWSSRESRASLRVGGSRRKVKRYRPVQDAAQGLCRIAVYFE